MTGRQKCILKHWLLGFYRDQNADGRRTWSYILRSWACFSLVSILSTTRQKFGSESTGAVVFFSRDIRIPYYLFSVRDWMVHVQKLCSDRFFLLETMAVNVTCGWLIVTFRVLVETCLATFTSTKKNCISLHDVPSRCCGNTPLLAKHFAFPPQNFHFENPYWTGPDLRSLWFIVLLLSSSVTTHRLSVFQCLVATVGFHPSFTYFTKTHQCSRPELEKLVWLVFKIFSPKPR